MREKLQAEQLRILMVTVEHREKTIANVLASDFCEAISYSNEQIWHLEDCFVPKGDAIAQNTPRNDMPE
ncbi:MAG: hypothetical protein Fur0043_04040 [Anaerolineales bacterium]